MYISYSKIIVLKRLVIGEGYERVARGQEWGNRQGEARKLPFDGSTELSTFVEKEQLPRRTRWIAPDVSSQHMSRSLLLSTGHAIQHVAHGRTFSLQTLEP